MGPGCVDRRRYRPTGGITLAPEHADRKEIARYLLSRGLDREPETEPLLTAAAKPEKRKTLVSVDFAAGDAPQPQPISPAPSPDAPLPAADVIVITWTADEADALAHVFTPGYAWKPPRKGESKKAKAWYSYAHNFAAFKTQIRKGAPALHAKRLATYLPVELNGKKILCMKSELHLNQDGITEKDAKGKSLKKATLPVKDFFKQIIAETGAKYVFTIGTAGSVFNKFGLGDVVVTRAARFRCKEEFANEPFNGATYRSNWKIPTTYLAPAQALMAPFFPELEQPPVGPPSPQYPTGELSPPQPPSPRIRLDGQDMPAFHPILTTDYFEYGTTVNRLDKEGAAVEMGDAALGLACKELAGKPPRWAVVRNMSDPVINGKLPAKQFHLNEQTTWAVGFYTAYGKYTSILGAITTWGIVRGL